MCKDVKTVQTSRGELSYYREWENSEGGIVMLNPQTIDRYKEIRNTHPNTDNYGCFWAFGKEQFNRNLAAARRSGRIKDNDNIKYHPFYSGLYGTEDGIRDYLAFYDEQSAKIPAECDPQEVYFYEFNNHESQISWDGDLEAIRIIISIWGAETAEKIRRFSAYHTIGHILNQK
ncbi:MAG: hypothetical protein K2I35_01960 [Duncaniella sp.]|nr:hypothetical protein [Duncaniella sp.]